MDLSIFFNKKQLALYFSIFTSLIAYSFIFKIYFFLNHTNDVSNIFIVVKNSLFLELPICSILATSLWLLHVLTRGKLHLLFYGIACVAITIPWLADFTYYANSGQHLTYETQNFYHDTVPLIKEILPYSFIILLPVLYTLGYKKLVGNNSTTVKITFLQFFPMLLIVAIIIVWSIRGDFFRPRAMNPAIVFTLDKPELQDYYVSAPYNVYYYLKPSQKEPASVPIPEVANSNKILQSLYPANNKKQIFQPANIIVVSLESLSGIYLEEFGDKLGITPHLNELYQNADISAGMIANGHRTSEGLFASYCSLQNPPGSSITASRLFYNKYNCLPHILNQHGYTSMYFQGTSVSTAQVGEMLSKLGFSEQYGLENIPNKLYEKHSWGIHDPDLYQFVLDKIATNIEPFIIGINNSTSHGDEIPKAVKGKFQDNSIANRIRNAVNFTDKSLYDFYQNIRKLKLTYPTLLIISADHTAFVTTVNQQDTHNIHEYLIPFMAYYIDGKSHKQQKILNYVSQRDIAPTIIDYLHITNRNFSGQSLLAVNRDYAADYYHKGILGWIENNKLLEINLRTNAQQCYVLDKHSNYPILTSASASCPNANMANTALALTKYNQELLISGNTIDFLNKFKQRG